MRYHDYLSGFRKRAQDAGLTLREYAVVQEAGENLPLVCASASSTVSLPELVVTAGFHGEEPAGPLTLLEHIGEVTAYARSRRIHLRVYPCVNPSGFQLGTRYNASGEKPNNDFLRYELEDGNIVGELTAAQTFQRFEVFLGGPKETRALAEDLERHPAPQAALDIHQDNYLAGAWTYAYVFGERSPYRALAHAVQTRVPVAANTFVDDSHRTDADGLVEFHDGSVSDYFLRRGAKYSAALETTTATPMGDCHDVNLAWIRGFIDLAASLQL